MGKAFASPRRLELLDLLAQAPRTRRRAGARERPVDRQRLPAPAGAARRRAWSRARARARASATRSPATRRCALWLALRDASAAQLAEVERAARDYLGDEVEAIGRDELLERLRRGDVVLVDVRPAEEFEAGHIEGARSIPLDELERPARRAAGRPRDRRLLPRPVLRLRARGGPPPAAPRAARRGGSRTAGPNGGSQASPPSAIEPPETEHETRGIDTRRRAPGGS